MKALVTGDTGFVGRALGAELAAQGAAVTPDPETTAIVQSWPRVLSGAAAAADWGWKPRFPLEGTVRDFVARVRATDTGANATHE